MVTPERVPIDDFSNGGSVTFEVTTNVPRTSWKGRPYFVAGTALIPVGGQIQIEYPEAGEVAMRFTITGGARKYASQGSIAAKGRQIRLDRKTLPGLQTIYWIRHGGEDSQIEFIPV